MDEQKKPRLPRRLWNRYGYLVTTAALTLVTFGLILVPAYVPTGSMENTLPTGSFFIGLRLPYLLGDPLPERGEIVMFESEELGEILVKRVIGLPGETVAFQEGNVTIDGKVLAEGYLSPETTTLPLTDTVSFTVPDGCVFFLGDNRGNSLDSRVWDYPHIPLSQLRAKAMVVIAFRGESAWRGVHLLSKS